MLGANEERVRSGLEMVDGARGSEYSVFQDKIDDK